MATLFGGAALKAKLAELSAKVAKPGTLNVGFLSGSTESKTGTPSAQVAFWNEFGDPAHNRPPRPFFRNMVASESPQWGDKLGKVLAATSYDVSRTLALMGEEIRGELVQSIDDLTTPALAPTTIARKGFAKPLVDTGDMRRAADFEVKT